MSVYNSYSYISDRRKIKESGVRLVGSEMCIRDRL
ncbi:hypothetical protein [Klebsiella pneumoniae]|nr:hypothetical protein [Klebsiella pneumoniae]